MGRIFYAFRVHKRLCISSRACDGLKPSLHMLSDVEMKSKGYGVNKCTLLLRCIWTFTGLVFLANCPNSIACTQTFFYKFTLATFFPHNLSL